MASKKQDDKKARQRRENIHTGFKTLSGHPIFAPLSYHISLVDQPGGPCANDGWVVVSEEGVLYTNSQKTAPPDEWAYVMAHCLLHLCFGHFDALPKQREWNAACDYFIARFLADFKIGKVPDELKIPLTLPQKDEKALYGHFCLQGIPKFLEGYGTGGSSMPDMLTGSPPFTARSWHYNSRQASWQELFALGLAGAVRRAVNVAAGVQDSLFSPDSQKSNAAMARQ